MRVIMRSTAPRYPRGRLARARARARSEAERSGRSLGSRALAREEARGSVNVRGAASETSGRRKSRRAAGGKEKDEVARCRQRTGRGRGRGEGGKGSSYTPYDGVGMRESALGRLRLEWRVWYVTMPRARDRRRRSKRWARAGKRAERG